MPEIKFTQEDLLERTQLAPGWRTLICKSVEEGPGKTDPTSITYPCVFVVDCQCPENGVPIRHWFSEKAMGRMVDYIKCFTGGKIEVGKVYELSQTIGQKVEGYCQYDLAQGYNVIKDWKPFSKAAKAGNGEKKG